MKHLQLVNPGALQPFVTCLTQRSIESGRYLWNHHISPESVSSGTGKILKRQMYRFFEDVAYKEGIGTLGMLAGDSYPISELGPVGSAVLNSATLKEAIDTFALLLPSVAEGNTIRLAWGPTTSWLCCRTDFLERADRIPDHTTVLVLREIIRLVAGAAWQPGEIRFYTEPDPAIIGFSGLEGARLRFLQDVTAVAFPTRMLHEPLCWKRVDGPLASVYGRVENPPTTTSEKLQIVLDTMYDQMRLPSGEEVAEMLGLSRTTMFRTLAGEGTSYRRILEQVRFKAAVRLLEDPALSMKEIAYELGYSSPGNFTRTFFRMSGVTPTRFRLEKANN